MAAEFLTAYGWMLLALVSAGCVAGFAAGLFGIGGGIVTVPVLYAVFNALNIADDPSLKTAIGTSLTVIIVTSVRSLLTHREAGHVDDTILLGWAPWIVLGSAFGGFVARWAPVELLVIVFAGGAAYVAYRRIAGEKRRPKQGTDLDAKRLKVPVGLGAGLFSSLMGLGGGAVGIMVMTMAGRPMHQAIATSAGFGIAVAVPGALAFMISGWGLAGLPPGSAGYVNFPAFLAVAIAAGLMAPIGARLAHRLDGNLLSRIFGIYVGLAAIGLVVDIFG